MDYGALPPEVNSGRLYAGPGLGPMLAAASAWDALATELYGTAAACGATLSELASRWSGPSSASMTAAATPYLEWLTSTAGHAEQTAMQARAAAAAYEAAFAMTVPPPVILANRVQLMTLIATNFFGQNVPAIAATEAHYAEMWAQDAAAMYAYAEVSAGASALRAFDEPPSTANPGGQAGQAAAVADAANSASQSGGAGAALGQGVAGATTSEDAAKYWKLLVDAYGIELSAAYSSGGSWEHFLKIWVGELPAAAAAAANTAGMPGMTGLLGGGLGASPMASAAVGSAGSVGRLSVPPVWAATAVPSNAGAGTVPLGAGASAPRADGLLRGLPLTGAGRRSGGVIGQRYGFRQIVMTRPVVGG